MVGLTDTHSFPLPHLQLSQNCIFGFESQPFNSDPAHVYTSTYQFAWGELMPTATLFVNIWIKCEDGTVCAFDNTENKNFIEVGRLSCIAACMCVHVAHRTHACVCMLATRAHARLRI